MGLPDAQTNGHARCFVKSAAAFTSGQRIKRLVRNPHG